MQPAFRLNAPQMEDDGDVEGSATPFGGIGDQIQNPTSAEFHLSDNYNGAFTARSDTNSSRLGISREEAITPPVPVEGKVPNESAGGGQFSTTSKKWMVTTAVLSILLLIGLVIAVSVTLTRDKTDSTGADESNTDDGSSSGSSDGVTPLPSSDLAPPLNTTLGRIYNEGILRCGIPIEQPGFAMTNTETSRMEGFDTDLCRAVAAAIFGPENIDDRLEFYPVTAIDRFQDLKDAKFDILARTTTHTMEREVLEPTTGASFSFSTPYLYNGLQYAGLSPYVECADNATVSGGDCDGTKICALDGSTHVDVILDRMPDAAVVAAVNPEFLYTNFIAGFCNVIAAEQFDLAEQLVRDRGYDGDYIFGALIHSKEPLCLVTRDDDVQFSDFVNWVMEALISADEGQITQDRASTMKSIEAFGRTFDAMSRDAVAAVGNYGEMYARSLESLLPRSVSNTINDGSGGGLLYAFPFASLSDIGSGPVDGGTLSTILERGYLRCGISTRVIFAKEDTASSTWTGFDVDFCKALSAAIFGVTDTVEYTDLSASERFVALANGEVDVLSRLTTLTLERDVNETATGQGFTFTQPNFYDGLTFGGIPPYGQCADDLVIIGSSCENILICVNAGTTFESAVKELFPERVIVVRDGDALEGLSDGSCNVVAGGVTDVSITSIQIAGFNGSYEIGSVRYSKDPLALVTRQDDSQWSKFVYWIVDSIIYAEEEGVTMDSAELMPEVGLFGERFRNMFINAIGAVGNYGEIYQRNAEAEITRGGLNMLNNLLDTPQIYPLPGIL